MNDICARKHGGNPQSVQANLFVNPYKRTMRDRIYEFICDQDRAPTCEDIVRAMGFKLQSVSARVSELKAGHQIVEGETRNGYATLRRA